MSAPLKSEVYGDDHRSKAQVFTEEEYLAIQKNSEEKLEFIDGKIYSMSNASLEHDMISANLDRALWIHLKKNPCKVYRDMLKIKHNTSHFRPDVVVDCSEDKPTEFPKNPILIIEVLSYSTRKNDLGIKFDSYQQLESLQEYAVIEQDSMCVVIYRREDNWEGERYLEGSNVEFKSIALNLPIEDIYEDIEFNRKIRTHLVLRR